MGEKWEELQNALASKVCVLMWGFETPERKALVIGWMKSESIDTLLQEAFK